MISIWKLFGVSYFVGVGLCLGFLTAFELDKNISVIIKMVFSYFI